MKNISFEKNELDTSRMSAEERTELKRLIKELKEPETSELLTGKLLVEVRTILQKYRQFVRFMNSETQNLRTGYRRIKMYDRICQIWPRPLVDAAIKYRLKVVGYKPQKPMGLFEDVEVPKTLKPETADALIEEIDLQVRKQVSQGLSRTRRKANPRDLLMKCFRMTEQASRHLSAQDRETFLTEIVGLQMTLFGEKSNKEFGPLHIPSDFWLTRLGGYIRSDKTRARFSAETLDRHERIRKAQ